jgi:hypothetical protein
VELRKPKTKIKMMGNKKLKMTADGLLKIDFKLAFAIANIAATCEYFFEESFIRQN